MDTEFIKNLIGEEIHKLKPGEKLKFEFRTVMGDKEAEAIIECEKLSERHVKCELRIDMD